MSGTHRTGIIDRLRAKGYATKITFVKKYGVYFLQITKDGVTVGEFIERPYHLTECEQKVEMICIEMLMKEAKAKQTLRKV